MLAAIAGGANVARAQGKAGAKAPANLTFDLTARIFYKDGASSSAPAQTIDAKVWLSGRKARLDTTLSGRPLRLLFVPPFAYRLLPAAKVGQKVSASGLPALGGLSGVVPGGDGLSPDPQAIRAALIRGGARKTGSTVLAGVPVDVFTSARFRGRADTVKAFLRRSDSLPARVEINSRNFSAVASWRNYQKPRALNPSLFAVPPGFKIRQGNASSF
jgi:hypothetical protein